MGGVILDEVSRGLPGATAADLALVGETVSRVFGPGRTERLRQADSLRLVAGLETPTQGQIRIAGQVVNELRPA